MTSPADVSPAVAADIPVRRKRRAPRMLITWVAALVLVIAHASIRDFGDQTFTPYRVGFIEEALFGVVPTTFLQEHVQVHDIVWLDFMGFLFHGAWFATPWVLGFAIMVARRRMLIEYFGWIVATTYIASIAFLLFPVEPPWMEIGSIRVLQERAFIEYTNVDNNQVAAMPSLHAGLPAALGLFALLRLQWRKTAMALFAYSLGVGFFVVYLGEHWVIDVFAGWALAALVGFLFTNASVAHAVNALPGHPLDAIRRFNAYWFPQRVRPAVEAVQAPEADAAPAPARRAA